MFRSARRFKFTPVIFLCVSAIAGSVATAYTPALPLSVAAQEMQLVSAPASATDRITTLAIAFGGTVAVCLGVNTLLNRSQQATHRQPFKTLSQRPDTISLDQASRLLQRKLLRLLHDDRALAERLFRQATLKYSGNTPNWYAEKVIYDLERDRGKF